MFPRATGKKRTVDALWRDLFSNTSQWWDHRPEKINPRFPDFKHKLTQESLWLGDARNPSWVQEELAAIPPGKLQSNDFAWAQRLKRLVKARQYTKAMEAFHQMQQERICPESRTFLPVLNACAGLGALEEGKRVHRQIVQLGYESDVFVANCLVDMYAKCGSIKDAWCVFDKMPEHGVVTWNTIIGGHVKSGQGLRALELYRTMQQEGVEPNAITFIGVLNACASLVALGEGRFVHEEIMRRGWESDVYLATCLVDMYAKCGSIEDAWSVFNRAKERRVVTWNAMVGGYVKSGQGLKALELFRQMQKEGVEPNAITFVAALNACASAAALEEGRRVHSQIIQVGCDSNVYVATCLVDMYAKCRSIEDAWNVFNKMRDHDVVTWNAMIGGFVKSKQELKVRELFLRMKQEGVKPDAVTFVGVLDACANATALEEGRYVHEQIIRRGCESNVYVANCLIDMYAKCGSIEDAWDVLNKMPVRNVVTWNTMIGGYAKSGQQLRAMEVFQKMQQEGVEPNTVTFIGVLNACATLGDLEEGRRVHKQIIQFGCQSDVYVATCLVDMYAKCGSIDDGWAVFHKMQEHSVVTWSAMIVGCVECGQGLRAIDLFRKMQQKGVEPNAVTFVGVLNACASVAALEEGRGVHKQIIRFGCDLDVYVATCLVDMYAKCGSIEDAWSVFCTMQETNVVTWNAMIGGYAMHGQAKEAIGLFRKMVIEGIEVNEITFNGLLSACSHGGLVKEGLRYFACLGSCFNILPNTDHYACMVDLLGRTGRLRQAEDLIKRMPLEIVSGWRSLLGACRIHGNVDIGERAAKRCWELDPGNASGYVLLSNIYAVAGKWDKSPALGEERLERGVQKEAGRTWIEVDSMVHSFIIDDDEHHPEMREIQAELDRLSVQMNETGYVPLMKFVLYDEKGEFPLCCNSEKLAIA